MVSETLPMLQECYAHLPEQQHNWAEFLKRCVEENTGATADLMLAEIIEQHEGRDVVQVYINRQLQRHPTMRVFYRLMDYHRRTPKTAGRKRACCCCATWSASKFAPSRVTAATNAASPRTRSIGIARRAAHGHRLNRSAARMANNAAAPK